MLKKKNLPFRERVLIRLRCHRVKKDRQYEFGLRISFAGGGGDETSYRASTREKKTKFINYSQADQWVDQPAV